MIDYTDEKTLSTGAVIRALSNDNRLKILGWIMDPRAHFPEQRDGDLIEDGVCVAFITEKIGLSQPSVTAHMKILTEAGLVTHKQVKNWVFYKPDKLAVEHFMQNLAKVLGG